MARLDPEEGFDLLKDRVQKAVSGLFPVAGKKNTLELHDIAVRDALDSTDIRSQKVAKLEGKSWAVPVEATISLKDNATGKVLDRQKIRLMNLPKLTNRYSHIVDGQEYQVDNQWRLKPGVYNMIKADGALESHFNALGGGFKIHFDPATREFSMGYGNSNIPLKPLLHAMGVPEEEVEKRWGKDIAVANHSDMPKALSKFYKADTGLKPAATMTPEDMRAHFWQVMDDTKLSPDVNMLTLGKAHPNVTGATLLDASDKLLKISRGEAKSDPRDALMFKDLHSMEDFAAERITQGSRDILRKIGNTVDKRDKVRDIIAPDTFNRHIRQMFSKNSLASVPSQINPLEMISAQFKTTIMGKGGIRDEHIVSDEAKLIDPSHLGFLDPIETPEGSSTGIVLRLPVGVQKKGHDVSIKMYNLHTGKNEDVNPTVAYKSHVVLPDQVRWVDGKPVPIGPSIKISGLENEIYDGSMKGADYVMRDPMQMFSFASNMIPFMPADHPNRSTMAGRQMEQAVSLLHREVPLVQSLAGAHSFDHMIGGFASHHSRVDGTVTQIKPDAVVIKDTYGKKHEVQIYDNFPLNEDKAFLHSTPIVKVGDKVTAGQTIADSNFTRGGVLAMGTNLRVGFMPYKGMNYEDGIVVTESAAKQLTSEHLHRHSIERDVAHVLDKRKFQAYIPTGMNRAQAEKLDDEGVIKPGTVVMPGDTLIAALRASNESEKREDVQLSKLHKSIVRPFKDASITWDKDYPGVVKEVVKTGTNVAVHVKTEEPLEIGDKITARHGNKGIITRIIPDHESPHTKDGRPLDVILNPLGVTGRTNLGQVLEVAAAKVAEKTGKTYFIKNFKPGADLHAQVTQDLEKNGLTDKETVYDPANGRPMGDVLVGPMHILKLHHQVEKKLSARALGYGYAYDKNKIPKGGGPHGAQSLGVLGLYSMLAHGSLSNLREMQTLKSDSGQGDQFWAALQAGEMLPTPKPTFAYNKFISLIKGLNVNVEKVGNSLTLVPMTDKQVKEMSNGELKDPAKLTVAKTMRPEVGGLFDPKITGGMEGNQWAHFVLPEAFPNPVFEGAITKLTGLKSNQFDGLVTGTMGYDPATGHIGNPQKMKGCLLGGKAFDAMLGKIDVKKDLAAALVALQKPKLKDSYLDAANKKVKFLSALDRAGLSARDAYMLKNVPVLPPSMRPLSVLPDGTISEEDLNGLYKGLHLTASRYAKMSPLIPEDDQSKVELRQEVYDGLRALSGLGGYPHGIRRGILDYISGKHIDPSTDSKVGQPKEGFFQEQLVTRKQDMTMRGTIIPEPSLSLDEVGIPKAAALELYKPFIIRELRNLLGVSPLAAQKKLAEGGEIVDRALDRVILHRPILLKRDPVLHKYGIQGLQPRIVSGKAIQVQPLITSSYNADFDGDSVIGEILLASVLDEKYADGMPHTGKLFSYKIVDLANFPHLPDPIRTTGAGVSVYEVPPGTFVPAYSDGAFEMSEVTEYSVHPACEEWRIETERGREMFVSEDHSLALLNPATLEVYDAVPASAEGMWLPTLRYLNSGPAPIPSLPGATAKSNRATAMLADVPATFDVGWFLGATVGDGWVSAGISYGFIGKLKDESTSECRAVYLAYGAEGRDVADKWDAIGKYIAQNAHTGDISAPHKFGDYKCQSFKSSVHSTALGLWLEPLIGKGAANKHLPDGFLHFPVEFRQGLFCGLIDTDGTVNWSNGVNRAPQFTMSYSTISPDLMESIQLLGLSLGLVASCTPTHTPAGKPSWVITFSIRTVQDADWIKLEHTEKRVALAKLRNSSKIAHGRADKVPLPEAVKEELLEHLRNSGAAKRNGHGHNAAAFSSYTVLKQSRGGVTRITTQNLDRMIATSVRSEYLSKWFNLALNENVGWDRVVLSKATGEIKTMYDLKVPGPWTFTMANGAAVWDCMGAFVPIGSDAVAEAYKMFPSNNLFSPASGRIMYSPSGESKLGLYGLTRVGAVTNHEFSTIQDVEAAVRKGEVKLTDQVKVGGIHSTVGRFMVAGALPEAMRRGYLETKDPLNSSAQEELMTRIAKEHKNEYGQSINKLKDLGNMWATQTAFSVGLKDLAPEREARDRILAKADALVSKMSGPSRDAKAIEAYTKATEELNAHLKAIPEEGNNLMLLHNMGMKGGIDTIRQIRTAPMLMANHKGEILPNPVRRSYAEGLDIAGYWTATSGGRKGVIQKVQAVQEPGHITKQVINSTMNNLILDHDCGTDKGIALSIDEKDILDRYTAADIKLGSKVVKTGTLITPELRSAFRNNNVGKVVVRSPLRCLHGPGLCAMCHGLTENGTLPEIGLNVGVLAGQALGERATQLAMKAFHGGGTAASKSSLVDQFEQVQDLLMFPKNLPGSATLSTVNGKVTKIEKDTAGGHNVIIEGERHYIPQSRGLPVYDKKPLVVGTEVKKGLPISEGRVNPHEMLPLTGLEPVQALLASDLDNMYKGQGIRRRNHEIVIKALTNLTKIKDPGSSTHFIRGDFAPTTYVSSLNRHMAKGERPIVHEPILKGVNVLPMDMQEDWMAKLNHEDLAKTVIQAAQQGWQSHIHSLHPIPAIVYAAELGKPPKEHPEWY